MLENSVIWLVGKIGGVGVIRYGIVIGDGENWGKGVRIGKIGVLGLGCCWGIVEYICERYIWGVFWFWDGWVLMFGLFWKDVSGLGGQVLKTLLLDCI